MQRRHFIKLFLASSLSGAGLGLSGCEEYVSGPYGRYDYDYYPDNDVYYHAWTGSYFYVRNGVWIRSRSLPVQIVLRPYYRRRIYVSDRYPYARNREHRRRYPPRTDRPSRKDRIISERERRRREELRRDRRDQRFDRYRTEREQQRRRDQMRERARIEQEQKRRRELRRERVRTEQERLELRRERIQNEQERQQRRDQRRERVRTEQEQQQWRRSRRERQSSPQS
ncbi:MAG: hypothetical protein HKN30_15275 [Sulfitobacter sp.]|nr:hypothetical protein [Sulfitobacter sp.]